MRSVHVSYVHVLLYLLLLSPSLRQPRELIVVDRIDAYASVPLVADRRQSTMQTQGTSPHVGGTEIGMLPDETVVSSEWYQYFSIRMRNETGREWTNAPTLQHNLSQVKSLDARIRGKWTVGRVGQCTRYTNPSTVALKASITASNITCSCQTPKHSFEW